METLIVPFLALAAAGYYGCKMVAAWSDQRAVQSRVRELNDQQKREFQRRVAAQQKAARQEHARRNQLYARLQMGLLQLNQAPDFQRAASLAQQAQDVPAAYRQYQFRRFRPILVQHFIRRLTAGEDSERLTTSLTALVQALGMAEFEAQYIESETQRRLPQTVAPQRLPYEEQLRRLQAAHDQRMATLRNVPGLEDDVREQMLEAEQTRFRESLLALDPDAARHEPSPPQDVSQPFA